MQTPRRQCMARAVSGNKNAKVKGYHQCSHWAWPGTDFCGRHQDKRPNGTWNAEEQKAICNSAWVPSLGMPVDEVLAHKQGPAEPEPPMPATGQKRRKVSMAADISSKISPATAAKLATPKDTAELQLYADFCTGNMGQLAGLANIGQLIKAPADNTRFYLSEVGLNAYFTHLLEQGTSLGQAKKKFSKVKECMRSLDLPSSQLPAWAEHGKPAPPLLSQTFRVEKRKAAEKEEPATEKGVLAPSDIMEYGCLLVVQHKQGSLPAHKVMQALLLWVCSGRSHRVVNLQGVKCTDCGYHASSADSLEEPPPYVAMMATKLLGTLSANQAADSKVKSQFTLKDKLSRELFQIWWAAIPDQHKSNGDCNFFPHVKPDGTIVWFQAMGHEEMNEAAKSCAKYLNLAHSGEHLATFSMKSLRTGIAAESCQIVQGALSTRNPMLGRAKSSKMEVTVYAPPRALVAPGLLHGNLEEISNYFDSHIHKAFGMQKHIMLCSVCGFPGCKCAKCISIRENTKQGRKASHECWLAGRGPGKIAKDTLKETEGQKAARLKAWTFYGINEAPVWRHWKFQWAE